MKKNYYFVYQSQYQFIDRVVELHHRNSIDKKLHKHNQL